MYTCVAMRKNWHLNASDSSSLGFRGESAAKTMSFVTNSWISLRFLGLSMQSVAKSFSVVSTYAVTMLCRRQAGLSDGRPGRFAWGKEEGEPGTLFHNLGGRRLQGRGAD